MERESFEDADVAKILNEKFISIKVDREERADIDSVYICGSLYVVAYIFIFSTKAPF